MVINCCSYHFYLAILTGWIILMSANHQLPIETKERYHINGKSNFFETDFHFKINTGEEIFIIDTTRSKESHNHHKP